VRLQRVSESLFRIEQQVGGGPARADRTSSEVLHKAGQLLGVIAGGLLCVTALGGGTVGNMGTVMRNVWLLGVVATALFMALVVAAFIMRERVAGRPDLSAPRSANLRASLDQLSCPICLNDVRSSEGLVLSPCGHTVCAVCFGHIQRSQTRGRCPVCRAAITTTFNIDAHVQENEFKGYESQH